MNAHDAVEDRERFLGWIASFFFAIGTNNRVPPDIGWRFATGGFFRPDQAGSHIRNAVNISITKRIIRWIFGIPQNSVVLG